MAFLGRFMLDRKYAYAVLGVLLLVNTMNQWDRYLMNYLSAFSVKECAAVCAQVVERLCTPCPTVNGTDCMICHRCMTDYHAAKYNLMDGTCISVVQYGVLTGFGFTALFGCVSLVAGRLADTFNRRNLLLGGMFVWSTATASQALADSFGALLASRVTLGMGEALASPISYSLIASYFDPLSRGRVNGIYSFGIYLGGGLASASILMSAALGWRWTCVVLGAVGWFAVIIIRIVVIEPPRDDAAKVTSLSFLASIKWTLSSKAMIVLYVSSAIRYLGGYSIAAFLPMFYGHMFPAFQSYYSVLNAIIVICGGTMSAIFGGVLADVWGLRSYRYRALVPALGSFIAIPCMIVLLVSPNFYVSMGFLFLEYLFAECWFGPIMSILQREVPPSMTGIASSMFVVITSFCGSCAPPVLAWFISMSSSPSAVKWALMVGVIISYAVAGIGFLVLAAMLKDGDRPAALLPDTHTASTAIVATSTSKQSQGAGGGGFRFQRLNSEEDVSSSLPSDTESAAEAHRA